MGQRLNTLSVRGDLESDCCLVLETVVSKGKVKLFNACFAYPRDLLLVFVCVLFSIIVFYQMQIHDAINIFLQFISMCV